MLLTRLYLRNFRVYEDELDLALPPGLVGIYGPNGAGKSTLLEAITFTLWGKARTGRDEIRSAGVGADCVTEVEFEHEGHLYVVRRSLSGINSTMRAEAHCDGLIMAEGATDTRRYVHSVLGMDDLAFKASVFAEQKQLAAFSSQAPAERRKLVLQLLGITPLDAARDSARRDARDTESRLTQLRSVLPDLTTLTVSAADAAARADASETDAATEAGVRDVARARDEEAGAAFDRLDRLRQAYDALLVEGRAARRDLDREGEEVTSLAAQLAELDGVGTRLAAALGEAACLEHDRASVDALRAVADAHRRLDALAVVRRPAPPDEAARDAARRHDRSAHESLSGIDGLLRAAGAEVERAGAQVARSAELSGEADCPLCGQALGEAFASVQSHRSAELHAAEERRQRLETQRLAASAEAAAAARAATDAERAWTSAERSFAEWEQAERRRREAGEALDAARRSLAVQLDAPGDATPDGTGNARCIEVDVTTSAATRAALEAAVGRVGRKDAAARLAEQLRGRLEGRPALEARFQTARERAAAADTAVTVLRDKVRTLAYEPSALGVALERRDAARVALRAAEEHTQRVALQAARDREAAEGEARRLAYGREQHGLLVDLESSARHLSRLAVLLAEFRNTVVASVGPRLAAQAAELFAELTDHEYDQLLVDPDTYELQISDAGRVHGLDRFSGSEVDLANLALRVAISEHVRFQSGGTVGLLVLDEVFGPLDEDRKARMLQALAQLGGRFRQILVVTHDGSIKEQLPNAVEVVKRPGRRATARVIA